MKNPKQTTFSLNGETFLTITGMAEKIGCNPQTIQRKVAQRKIRHIRVMNRLLFRPEFADEFINNLVVAPK